MKYGPCSRRRLAPVARLQDKVVRMSLFIRLDVHIELSYGSVQLDMLKLRGSVGQLTLGTVCGYPIRDGACKCTVPLFCTYRKTGM